MGVFETKRKTASVSVAKDRLKALLVSDRVNCTPDAFDKIKLELFKTVSKYLDVASDEFEVQITRTDIHIKLTGEDL
ncbi:MAG: cell division topological specificity factor MinE [Methanobrevibacter sp.]|nr:cell division topological specificity factor MinE [Methanobrevibacter sp.]